MKLRNSLYNIKDKEVLSDGGTFNLHLDPECFIYKVHFPEQPITPGVCVTQIAMELAEDVLNCPLEIEGVKNVKFLSVMSPQTNTEVIYTVSIKDIDDTTVSVQSVAKSDTEVYAKMSLRCRRTSKY